MAIFTKMEIENILYTYFHDLVGRDFPEKIIVADAKYQDADLAWVMNCITTDPILAPCRYKKDIFDCDDYVLYVKTKVSLYAQNNLSSPMAVGFIFTQRHAFNFSIDDESRVHVINTQSDDRKTTCKNNEFESFLKIGSNNKIQLIYI